MRRSGIRNTTLACAGTLLAAGVAALVVGLGALPGCAASPSQVRTARAAAYDAAFAVVYNQVLATVRALYPTMHEDAAAGVVRTSWHEVRLGNTDPGNPYQRDFVRFDVHVLGGRPWRVRVSGQAARWDFESAMPAPLEGGDEPPWLAGRIDALQVAIHERLARHVVTVAQPAPSGDTAAPAAPAADPARFGDIPPAAGQAVARVAAALEARDFEALGAAMHQDFTWSLGAPPSARDALVMWQADGTLLAALEAALEAGCRTVPPKRKDEEESQIACPPASAAPGFAGPRARFEPGPDGTWKMRSFLTGH